MNNCFINAFMRYESVGYTGCEYTGHVSEVGSDVSNAVVGDRVVGFINGGAYAEEIVVENVSA